MDHCAFPKRVCKRLIQINGDLQHVNAEMISREVAPEKIARQLVRIDEDLRWVESKIGVPVSPDACCKSPRAMAASLDAQLAPAHQVRPLTLAKTPDAVGDKLHPDADQHEAHKARQGVHAVGVQPAGDPH